MRKVKSAVAICVVMAMAVACASLTKPTKPVAKGKAAYGEYGLSLDWMDKSVKPGDDFYLHGVGGWEQRTPIPEDRSSYGVDTIIGDQVETDLHAIAESAAAGSAPEGSPERKVGDFYASYMDVDAIEAKGLAPLQPRLDKIAAVKTQADLAAAFIDGVEGFGVSPVGLYVNVDEKRPDIYSVHLYQSGLGLPNRDYYLKREKEYENVRAAYRAYIEQMLTLAGDRNARPRAESILVLETRIARAHWPAEEARDAEKTYNPMSLEDLTREAPGIDWTAFAIAAGIEGEPTLIVGEKSAFPNIARIAATTNLDVWKAYLTFHTLDQASPFLAKAFDDANFAFRGKVLGGRTVQRDRWKRAVRLLDSQIGQVVGQVYVARRFPPAARAAAQALVTNTKIGLHQLIDEAAWLDDATKAQARIKLDAMVTKVGYPDVFRDYTALTVVRGDALGNVARGSSFEYRRNIAKLGKPIDRTEWYLSPQIVNAYYDAGKNEIVFPAAILQPPYFDQYADPAVNYGAIGAVIGHEISHGFDDQGRKFDAVGKLQDWWTKKDAEAYTREADKLVAQFNTYEPIVGLKINGKLTLGENIADLAGLAIAYRAYKLSLGGKPAPVRDGLTGDQRFFIAYAQSWAGKRREAALRQQVLSNPHSPERYRVNGIVRNFGPWYDAFAVQPTDKLYLKPEERVRLW